MGDNKGAKIEKEKLKFTPTRPTSPDIARQIIYK